jgi:hypothetical protein
VLRVPLLKGFAPGALAVIWRRISPKENFCNTYRDDFSIDKQASGINSTGNGVAQRLDGK